MTKTIAIVEDEPAIRENYAAAFTREGYAVRSFASRPLALQAFASRLPDLVVIDISLGDEPEGGYELCRELRSDPELAGIGVVVATASVGESCVAAAYEAGADDFMAKPFSLATLLGRVRTVASQTSRVPEPARAG